jgi:hypothetical protein
MPLEASGIICGVASKLAAATRSRRTSHDQNYEGNPTHLPHDALPGSSTDAVEISFLSTVRAGTVIVGERELDHAIAALDAESGDLPWK